MMKEIDENLFQNSTHLVENSAKLKVLEKLLKYLYEKKSKVVVVYQMTK